MRIALLVIIFIGAVVYGYLDPTNTITTSKTPYLIGYCLGIGLVIWCISRIIFGKEKAKNVWIIIAALITGSFVGYYQHRGTATQTMAETQVWGEIQKSVSTFADGLYDAQINLQRIEAMDTTPKVKGEFGELERSAKNLLNKKASLHNDYLLEFKTIGWERVLDADRIMQDKNLTESKVLVQKAYGIVRNYKAKAYALLDDAKAEIGSLNVSKEERDDFLLDFNVDLANQRSRSDAIWDLENKAISEVENIIVLLSARQGTWAIQNGQVLFSDQADLDAFNSYIAAIKENSVKQQSILRQSLDTIKKYSQ